MEKNYLQLDKEEIRTDLLKMVAKELMPTTLAKVLTPLELEQMWVVHPTDNDPILMSSKYGAVAIWFQF